jgi:hypothetical protein
MNNVFSVEQLFAGRLFRAPDYQRGYSWETHQRNEFLEDLDMLGSVLDETKVHAEPPHHLHQPRLTKHSLRRRAC